MKKTQKLIVAITMIVLTTQVFGQIKDIKISDEITINKVYAGMLSGTMFSLDSLSSSNFVNVRFGSELSYKPSEIISFHAWGIYQADAVNFYSTSYWTKITPIKNWDIEAGKLATLATEHRPHPVTSDGQFETWAQAQSPLGALGVKSKYHFSESFTLGAGVFQREHEAEYQLAICLSSFRIAGYYTKHSEQFGGVASLSLDRFYSTVAWKQDEVLATTIAYNFGSQKDLQVYTDQGYDLNTKQYVRGEIGLLKLYNSKWVSGNIGLGYDIKTNTINGYLFIHL